MDAVIAAPFGAFGISTDGNSLTALVFLPPGTPAEPPRTPLAARAAGQIEAWLQDPATPFDLPLAPQGTPFQQKVWAAISAIPRGQVLTYGAMARSLGSAARAVGQACGANPYPLVVPCHRVVSAAGIGGFANARDGHLIATKKWLLALEQAR
jgi:methylated-DNA-[protein]-cysteine S-methyltransferase